MVLVQWWSRDGYPLFTVNLYTTNIGPQEVNTSYLEGAQGHFFRIKCREMGLVGDWWCPFEGDLKIQVYDFESQEFRLLDDNGRLAECMAIFVQRILDIRHSWDHSRDQGEYTIAQAEEDPAIEILKVSDVEIRLDIRDDLWQIALDGTELLGEELRRAFPKAEVSVYDSGQLLVHRHELVAGKR